MMRKSFRKIPLLLAVCGLAFALAGCGGTSSPTERPPSWPPSAGLWCYDTRQRVDLTVVPANDVHAAVGHVNDNPEAFILAIDEDVSTPGNTLTAANANLTVVGLGGVREIRSMGSRIFTVGLYPGDGVGSTVSLTLGNNITLVGRAYGNHGSMDLVRVRNHGRLYMEAGSRITGHVNGGGSTGNGFGAAVNIERYGTFTMRGGEITGNRTTSGDPVLAGGVSANYETSHFYMKGGHIHGNTRGANGYRADIRINQGVVSLSGGARAYRIILASAGNNSSLTIGSGWSGTVYNLDLRGGGTGGTNWDNTITGWTGNAVLQAADGHTLSAADLANIASARFVIGTAAAGVYREQDLSLSDRRIDIESNEGVVQEITP